MLWPVMMKMIPLLTISLPYPDQLGSGEMYEFPGAKKWFYEQEGEEIEVNLMHVIGTGIGVMNGIAQDNNMPPGPVGRKQTRRMQ